MSDTWPGDTDYSQYPAWLADNYFHALIALDQAIREIGGGPRC